MNVLMLDNYDSFTYNIVHYLEALGVEADIFKNDKISLEDIDKYDKIVLSPGPGLPDKAGVMIELIKEYASQKSILGINLGHLAIAQAFGAQLYKLDKVKHGKSGKVKILVEDRLFKDIPGEFVIGKYQSHAVRNLPDCLEVLAMDEEGGIQAVRHKKYEIHGLQFHPESVMTEYGMKILNNWLKTGK